MGPYELVLPRTGRLSVRELVVEEALNEPFFVSLLVRADTHRAVSTEIGELARFEAWLPAARGERVTEPATWTGVVVSVEDVGGDGAGHGLFRIELASRLWTLSQNRNHRVFQQIDEISIATRLLGEWGIPFHLEIDPARYPKREIRVQLGESDLEFLQRCLEEVGVSFHLVEMVGEETVVLTDAPHRAPLRVGALTHAAANERGDVDVATALRVIRRVRPARYLIQDVDPRRAPSRALRPVAHDRNASALEQSIERFHHAPGSLTAAVQASGETPVADDKGAFRVDETFARFVAQIRLESKLSDRVQVSFRTSAHDLHPGMVVAIRGHDQPSLAEPLLVTRCRLSASDSAESTFECEAAPTSLPYRPRLRSPRPSASGVESAAVVGPEGAEVHTDELGRVRVQFHWDRSGTRTDDSSCWIPVSQPWAGAGFGAMYLPRVGQEVLVQFLGGNPDCPVVVGRVYTALERVPYALPAAQTVTVIAKTSTFGGGGGYNEIKADDRAGGELLAVRAERDLTTLVRHDESRTIGHVRTTRVEKDDVLVVAGTETRAFTSPRPDAPITTQTNTNGFHELRVGSASVVVTDGNVTATSPKIVLTTGGGATITLEGSTISIDAATVNVTGTTVDVKGTPIKLNCR